MTMTPELRAFLRGLPGRCHVCCAHVESQKHNDGCAEGERLRDAGMARTMAAHPDDAARVNAVLDRFIATGKPFSANDTRPYLAGVKGSVVGSCWRQASQADRIKRTGRRFRSTDPGTHAHHIDEWIAA